VVAALDAIPYDATFVEVHDDVDTVLVFEHAPPAAATATRLGAPDAPAQPQRELAAA
jgi:hypothetical protein